MGDLNKKRLYLGYLGSTEKITSAEKKEGRKGESVFISTNDVSRKIEHIGGRIRKQLDS